nr:hypothetical protein [Sphingomonas sp. CDS-1]
MLYVALIFLTLFVAFFVREAVVSFRTGIVTSRGLTFKRHDKPILYWLGLSGWVFIAVTGAAFALLLMFSTR